MNYTDHQTKIIKGIDILAELKHQKDMLNIRGKVFYSWEIRITPNDQVQLVIHHNDGFYTVSI